MKILILFALLFSLPAFARFNSSCNDSLTLRVEGEGFAPYDLLKKTFNWSANFDRPLKIDYVNEDGSIESVEQTALNWPTFSQRFPQFAKYGSQVLERHHTMMRYWHVRRLRALSLFGNRAQREMRRQMPGEAGKIAAFSGATEISTDDVLTSVWGEGQATQDDKKMLSMLKMDSTKLIKQLSESGQIANHQRIDVLLFHSHPAGAIPLSPEDDELAITTLAEFRYAFPRNPIRVVIVAAARDQAQGDLIFISERHLGF